MDRPKLDMYNGPLLLFTLLIIANLSMGSALKQKIDWEKVEPEAWFDLKKWKSEVGEFKHAAAFERYRSFIAHKEKAAYVMACYGQCYLEHQKGKSQTRHNSPLFEGEQVFTADKSAMWIGLSNGSIVRLSANSALSIMELNHSEKSSSLHLRLNRGFVYFESRFNGSYPPINLPESDQAFLPVMEKVANREYFQRVEYSRLSSSKRALYEAEKNAGAISQYKYLNELMADEVFQYDDSTFIHTNDGSLKISSAAFVLGHKLNGGTYLHLLKQVFNLQSDTKSSLLFLSRDEPPKNVVPGSYMLKAGQLKPADVERGELLLNIRRIPSIHITRERMHKRKFSGDLAKPKFLWTQSELTLRDQYLLERRGAYESNMREKIAELFEASSVESVDSVNKADLKAKYTHAQKRMSFPYKNLRRSSDLDFYYWMLKNGK